MLRKIGVAFGPILFGGYHGHPYFRWSLSSGRLQFWGRSLWKGESLWKASTGSWQKDKNLSQIEALPGPTRRLSEWSEPSQSSKAPHRDPHRSTAVIRERLEAHVLLLPWLSSLTDSSRKSWKASQTRPFHRRGLDLTSVPCKDVGGTKRLGVATGKRAPEPDPFHL
jgi:hypothetical protein